MTSESIGTDAPVKRQRLRAEIWKFVEIFAISGLAFAQPNFDFISRNAVDIMIPERYVRADVIAWVVLVLLVPPAIIWLASFGVRSVVRSRSDAIHFATLGLLTAASVLQILGPRLVSPTPFSAAFVVSMLAIVSFRRWSAPRRFLRFFAISPFLFVVTFALSPGPSQVMFPRHVPEIDDSEIKSPTRVVVIVLDEFPTQSLLDGNGAIEGRLFPNFAALAADSTWFRNNTAVAPYTFLAVPAIATGMYPRHIESLAIEAEYPQSLFTALAGTYRMNVFEPSFEALCSSRTCNRKYERPLKNRFIDTAQSSVKNWVERLTQGPNSYTKCLCGGMESTNQIPLAKRFIRSLAPNSRPTLDYVHLELPHTPWSLTATGQRYAPKGENLPGIDFAVGGFSDTAAADRGRQRHLLQLVATDTLIGEILGKLRDIDAYDDSLVIVTADHGVGLTGDEPFRTATESNYAGITYVPLFMKFPGAGEGSGITDDRPARSIDILPTVMDVLDLDTGWDLDGVSLIQDEHAISEEERGYFEFLDWPTSLVWPLPESMNYRKFDRVEGLRRVLDAHALPRGAVSGSELYRLGPYANLIGQPVEAYVRDPQPVEGVQALITNGIDFLDVNVLADNLYAAQVKGGLSGTTQRMLAVAIHGVIAGIAPTFPTILNSPQFEILIDPAALTDGMNDAQIYEVSGPVSNPILKRIARV